MIRTTAPMLRASASRRCPVCGRPDWCLIAPDGSAAICARIESEHRSGNAGWLHRLSEPATRRPRPASDRPPQGTRAADADLDRVYRAVLVELTLTDRHRQQLVQRGLTDPDLARAGYRSLPSGCRAGIARRLRDVFPDELLLTVPGIIDRDGPHGRYLTLGGAPGLIIPIRTVGGLIVGLVVRPDEPGDGGKYRWISSTPSGPSPTARVHIPASSEPRQRVIVTEGSLKADIASALAPGRTIIGLPGPHVTDEAIAVLRALGAREALLALDSDAATNPHVARAQLDGLLRLRAEGFVEGRVKWAPELGKGLDDLLATLRRRQRS